MIKLLSDKDFYARYCEKLYVARLDENICNIVEYIMLNLVKNSIKYDYIIDYTDLVFFDIEPLNEIKEIFKDFDNVLTSKEFEYRLTISDKEYVLTNIPEFDERYDYDEMEKSIVRQGTLCLFSLEKFVELKLSL